MDNPNSIESSGAFGIPKWIMKKGMRYEVDDFIVSPPTNEDEGFLKLRYGRCPSPRHQLSSLDQAEGGLGVTVEVVKSGPGISEIGVNKGEASFLQRPTITIGPGVLSAESSPPTTPESLLDSAEISPQHMLPSPISDSETAIKHETLSNFESTLVAEGPSRSSLPSMTTVGSAIATTFRKISSTKQPSIQDLLKEEDFEKQFEGKILLHSATDSPDITPDPTPKSSPLLQRRVPNIVMENPKKNVVKHGYFCTKPFLAQGTQQPNLGGNTTGQEGVVERATGSSNTANSQLMEEGAKSAQTLETAGNVMGKRRQRPKPSQLREMNFWAPTSM